MMIVKLTLLCCHCSQAFPYKQEGEIEYVEGDDIEMGDMDDMEDFEGFGDEDGKHSLVPADFNWACYRVL